MALIKCPDCGKEVSSQAVACPVCGFPIAKANPKGTVAIKVDVNAIPNVKIFVAGTDVLLWEGRTGEVARFQVDRPTAISIGWGLNCASYPSIEKVTVEAGGRYECKTVAGFWMPKNIFNRIDTIDSD